MPLRIAFLGNSKSVHVQRWVGEFVRRGFECIVLTCGADSIDGARTVDVCGPRSSSLGLVARVRRIRHHLAEFRPDILHAHYAQDYGTWGALSGFRPLVVTCWGSDLNLAPKASRLARWKVATPLAKADLVTADSSDLLSTAISLGARPDRTVQVVMGVDSRTWKPCPESSGRSRPVVLSTRRLEPIYRLGDLIEASAILWDRGVGHVLRIASYGSLSGELRQDAARLGIEAHVEFPGRLSGVDLLAAYQQADVYTTVPESDGTAVSLLEAMACALPVVATDLPANRQWLGSEGGELVSVGNPGAVADGLARLLGDPALRATMGARNRDVVVKQADWSTEMDRVEEMYERLSRGAAPCA